MFDHEKLEVYKLELLFITWATPLLKELKEDRTASLSEVRDQLDRASLSALLNTAEGNSKRYKNVRAKYFDDARGSATESAACLDAIVAKGACESNRVDEGKDILLRIVQMLTRLVQNNSSNGYVKEETAAYIVLPEENSELLTSEYDYEYE